MATFQLILALAAQYGWDVNRMDVVTAFLNPRIDRDNIYTEMPLGINWLASSGSVSSGSASNGSVSNGSASNGSASNGSVSNGSASNRSASNRSALTSQKALYGLKQAPTLWYEDIDGYLQSIGIRQSEEDPNLYLQQGVPLVLMWTIGSLRTMVQKDGDIK